MISANFALNIDIFNEKYNADKPYEKKKDLYVLGKAQPQNSWIRIFAQIFMIVTDLPLRNVKISASKNFFFAKPQRKRTKEESAKNPAKCVTRSARKMEKKLCDNLVEKPTYICRTEYRQYNIESVKNMLTNHQRFPSPLKRYLSHAAPFVALTIGAIKSTINIYGRFSSRRCCKVSPREKERKKSELPLDAFSRFLSLFHSVGATKLLRQTHKSSCGKDKSI